ncbi:hypothetical protein CJF42_05140 [Pseudoalteromonas sp. NBT06-2]|uniref:hypothetical protein n=1 Tax=Pseudoalteromonas sp. NBT06-2 TaxID=2025950 RepID=UPI000BA7D8FC|nr:hypothetical protein [Pseudoalteromonas sp. NBT06-2]PAJ75523.1 hypothetical protein CJF42_05140 [Pseudoalteromonas sp. NBT06-2]
MTLVSNKKTAVGIKEVPYFLLSDSALNIRKSLLLFSFIGILLSYYNIQLLDISLAGLKVKGITFDMLSTIFLWVIFFKSLSFIINILNEYNAWKLSLPKALAEQVDDYFKTMLPELSEKTDKMYLNDFAGKYTDMCISLSAWTVKERFESGNFLTNINIKIPANKEIKAPIDVVLCESQVSQIAKEISDKLVSSGKDRLHEAIKNDALLIHKYQKTYKNCRLLDVCKVWGWDILVPSLLALISLFYLMDIKFEWAILS